jgi:hypothetical protein
MPAVCGLPAPSVRCAREPGIVARSLIARAWNNERREQRALSSAVDLSSVRMTIPCAYNFDAVTLRRGRADVALAAGSLRR